MALHGKVALVTGGSRGVGKGIALGLGEAGATVYVTARSAATRAQLPGTAEETAELVSAMGGKGIAVTCDHRDDAAVAAVFERIDREQGRIDILVNNVFAIPDGPLFNTPFWQQPIDFWDSMHAVGLRSHYVASRHRGLTMARCGAHGAPRRDGRGLPVRPLARGERAVLGTRGRCNLHGSGAHP
jgi:dehydrogenase/reductase SDR family protein 1